MVNERGRDVRRGETGPVTMFGPDFPFPFDDWITHPAGLGSIPAGRHGEEVAVVGAGISGLVAAYELMRLGLKPVVYEASRMGGRLRSQAFAGTSLASLHSGAPRAGVAQIGRESDGRIAVTDAWGDTRRYAAVLTTCQSWLLTTQIECEESLFSHKIWAALDRTRYMQPAVLAGSGAGRQVRPAVRPAGLAARAELAIRLHPATRRMTPGKFVPRDRYETGYKDAVLGVWSSVRARRGWLGSPLRRPARVTMTLYWTSGSMTA
jgi:hypothetical protein